MAQIRTHIFPNLFLLMDEGQNDISQHLFHHNNY